MNDITICKSDECGKKMVCCRHTVKPDARWQSYADFFNDCKKNKYQNYIQGKNEQDVEGCYKF